MAEASSAAATAAVSQHRFFCHSCKGEVSPKLPEYTCPQCESGFIEEVTDDSRYLPFPDKQQQDVLLHTPLKKIKGTQEEDIRDLNE